MSMDREGTSDYVWCLHCERTYTRAEADKLDWCPYDDCDGDTFMDAWDWDRVRDIDARYPVVPVRGKTYSQYGGD